MVVFLSADWLTALDEAAQGDDRLHDLTVGLHLTIEQHVDGAPDGDAAYHVRIADGSVRVVAGPAEAPDVRFRQDHATAVAIASGARSAQRAFMAGHLQVGGDLQVLVERGEVLAALHDVFATVRAGTTGLTTLTDAPADPSAAAGAPAHDVP